MPQVLSLHRIPSDNNDLVGRFFEDDFYGTLASTGVTSRSRTVVSNQVLNTLTVNVLATTKKIIVFAVGVGAYSGSTTIFNLVLTRNGVQLLGDVPVSDGRNPRNGIGSMVLDAGDVGNQTFTLQGARLVPAGSNIQSHHLRIVLLDEDGTSQESSG